MKINYPKKYVVWDLETSDLSPSDDKILEIGAMLIDNGEVIKKESWLLNHGIEISEFITNLTGIDKKLIDSEGIDPIEAYGNFLDFSEAADANLTHNGYKFDIPFLFKALTEDQLSEHKDRLTKGVVDTAVVYKATKLEMSQNWNETFLSFARRVMDVRAFGVKYNIPLCCEELKIDSTGVTMHRALGDAELTSKIYQKICLEV